MSRREAVSTYWASKSSHITSMLLKKNAAVIDALEKPEILQLLPSFEGKSVLDLGAGIGRFTTEFAKLAKKVAAVDLCPHFIETNQEANGSHKNIEWICADALDVRFAPEQFDLVFTNCLLMYLTEKEVQVLAENIRLWLKPKGVFFFIESCAAVTHFSGTENYYAHYRSPLDYEKNFNNWPLIKEGNIHVFEDLLADPFKCFWLYARP